MARKALMMSVLVIWTHSPSSMSAGVSLWLLEWTEGKRHTKVSLHVKFLDGHEEDHAFQAKEDSAGVLLLFAEFVVVSLELVVRK